MTKSSAASAVNAKGEWYYQAPKSTSVIRVDWNGWGHTASNSCVYGTITDAPGNNIASGSPLYVCNGNGSTQRGYQTQCTQTNLE